MKYYKCNDVLTVDGQVYDHCVVRIEEIEPSGNAALDRSTTLNRVMEAVDIALDGKVENFSTYQEVINV